jgi:hypothetical protein
VTANPEKGEVELVVGDVTYVLVTSFAGMLALQNLHTVDGVKPTIESILSKAAEGDLEAFRNVFWALFRRHHPDMTLDQAERLMDDVGGMAALNAILTQAMHQGGPDPRDVQAMEVATGRPPKAARAAKPRGIGERLR